jgi:hypothetical protein
MGTRIHDRERGAVMAVTLIAVTALLALGAVTVLGVRSGLTAAAQSRFTSSALYAAESGVAAGMVFLRKNCSTLTLFSAYVSANNEAPQSPTEISGNGIRPGETGNPFAEVGGIASGDLWYQVTIFNNRLDPMLAAGQDTDGAVTLRSTGYGPDNTIVVLEVDVQNQICLAIYCEHDYSQRGVTSRNDAFSACSPRLVDSTLRRFTP